MVSSPFGADYASCKVLYAAPFRPPRIGWQWNAAFFGVTDL